MTRRKVDVEARRAGYRDKPVPAVLERDYEGIPAELAKQAEIIRQKRAEWNAPPRRATMPSARWRKLIRSPTSRAAAPSPATPSRSSQRTRPPVG
ncbi:MAG: hypothetical protein IPI40_03325 [Betaproteobacteria bacterium]|nr:hypothetical protein [Betaproteobacteria bacterium]